MSADRTTEILNYLSAMTRDIAEMRAALEARLGRLEAEARAVVTRLDRIESTVLQTRADVRDLEDRAAAVERK